jgi:hypothetical protein
MAWNLENAHQGSKVFGFENPDDMVTKRREHWLKKMPLRHKHDPKIIKKWLRDRMLGDLTINNCILYSIFFTSNSAEPLRLTYVECRAFYCFWYAYYATRSKSFNFLKRCLENGINVEICGYDVPRVSRPKTPAEFGVLYRCEAAPFGHELVLAALLLDVKPLPWIEYVRENSSKYKNLFPEYLGAPAECSSSCSRAPSIAHIWSAEPSPAQEDVGHCSRNPWANFWASPNLPQ